MRAGVIPFSTTTSGQKLFALGVDSAKGDLSDFGGKIEFRETKYDAAARELREESLGALRLSAEYIRASNCTELSAGRCTIFFVEIPMKTLLGIPILFEKARKLVKSSEMRAVKLMFESDLHRHQKKIYDKVANVIFRSPIPDSTSNL